MVGFAKAGGVTGGWDGAVVTINNLTDLNKYIGDSTARVLVINSNIAESALTKVSLGSNKLIIGSFGQRTLKNIHFRATPNTGNIIFQNLVFEHDVKRIEHFHNQRYRSKKLERHIHWYLEKLLRFDRCNCLQRKHLF